MPADPALHPAHVVAVRPDVDGAEVRRGEYILSVETPKGARNVVAPADGRVELHVSLMQDVEPGTPLFSIAREAEAPASEVAPSAQEDPPAARDEPDGGATARSPAETTHHDDRRTADQGSAVEAGAKEASTNKDKSFTTLQTLFALICIASAVLLPGIFYQIEGPQVQWGISKVLLAIGLLGALLIPIWLLSKVRALGGSDRAGPASAAFMFAIASFGVSLFFPSVRSFQESAVAPVSAPAKAVLLYRADVHNRMGNSALAAADATRVIELAPKFPDAYVTRGVAYYDQGKYDLAIADFTTALKLDPKVHEGRFRRAKSYSRQGKHNFALVDYTKAIEQNPKHAKAYVGRAVTRRWKSRFEEALEDVDKAIELEPGLAVAYRTRAFLYAAMVRRDTKVPGKEFTGKEIVEFREKEIADLNKAIKLDPDDPIAYHNRSTAYQNIRIIVVEKRDTFGRTVGRAVSLAGLLQKALPDVYKRIELNPEYYLAYENRARLLRRVGRGLWQKAFADANKAIELDSDYFTAYANRAKLHKKLGKADLAKADWQKYEDLYAKWKKTAAATQ